MDQPKSVVSVFGSKRVWLLVSLGFSSGLPIYLVMSTLAAWLTKEGLNVKTIGLFSAASAPYTFKFVWSPLLDRYALPFLGRRRGWMLLSQVLIALCFWTMSAMSPVKTPWLMGALTLATAFFAASQDVVIDAYRTDILSAEERAAGTATFLLGYRLALLVAGAGALILSDHWLGWHGVYRLMATLMLIGIVSTLVAREPTGISPPRSLQTAVVDPFRDFFMREGALVVLLFLILCRAGEQLGGAMLTPFLIKTGFSLTEIGTVTKVWGLVATLSGTFITGLALPKLGMRKSLLLFGLLQAATNGAYMLLAHVGRDLPLMAAAVAIHNVSIGLADGAQVTFQVALCSKRFSATQYALLSSLSTLPRILLGPASGFLAAAVGWTGFFGVALLAGLPALGVLAVLPGHLAIPRVEEAKLEEAAARDTP